MWGPKLPISAWQFYGDLWARISSQRKLLQTNGKRIVHCEGSLAAFSENLTNFDPSLIALTACGVPGSHQIATIARWYLEFFDLPVVCHTHDMPHIRNCTTERLDSKVKVTRSHNSWDSKQWMGVGLILKLQGCFTYHVGYWCCKQIAAIAGKWWIFVSWSY